MQGGRGLHLIVYFVPEKLEDKIDAIYASMHFERMFLPDEYDGTPTEAGHNLEDQIKELEAGLSRWIRILWPPSAAARTI